MKKRIIVYLSVIAIIVYIATPNYISGRQPISLSNKIHISLHDISRIIDFYINKQKKIPNTSREILEFAKQNGYYTQTVNFFYDELDKPLKLIELKTSPNNVSIFKEIKRGDEISIAYYIKKTNNKIMYDIYAVDGQNRFLGGNTIIFYGGIVDLTQSNAR